MSRLSLREKLLEAGVTVLHQRGYSACGVREIAEAAGVPLGSFTNHFRSKEEFAGQVLDRYLAVLMEVVTRTLRDESRRPLERIAGYFEEIGKLSESAQWRFGCMVANMGLELPVHSEAMRVRIAAALDALTRPFADALRDGQAAGQVRFDIAADDLAAIVLAGWHGSALRAKVERDGAATRSYARLLPLLLQPRDTETGCEAG